MTIVVAPASVGALVIAFVDTMVEVGVPFVEAPISVVEMAAIVATAVAAVVVLLEVKMAVVAVAVVVVVVLILFDLVDWIIAAAVVALVVVVGYFLATFDPECSYASSSQP